MKSRTGLIARIALLVAAGLWFGTAIWSFLLLSVMRLQSRGHGGSMRAGVLILGSLLWDNGTREAWRRAYLDLEEATHVKVPIRYGRRSSSRGDTFTMSFDPTAPLGQAVLVPCIKPVRGVPDLVEEAEALWQAEHRTAEANRLGSDWACVSVHFRNGEIAASLAAGWSAQHLASTVEPIAPCNNQGTLDLASLITEVSSHSVDLVEVILTTAARPVANWASPREIAQAWVEQSEGHERYFFENIRNGIRTFEDPAIWVEIRRAEPGWLTDSRYKEATRNLAKDGV